MMHGQPHIRFTLLHFEVVTITTTTTATTSNTTTTTTTTIIIIIRKSTSTNHRQLCLVQARLWKSFCLCFRRFILPTDWRNSTVFTNASHWSYGTAWCTFTPYILRTHFNITPQFTIRSTKLLQITRGIFWTRCLFATISTTRYAYLVNSFDVPVTVHRDKFS